MKEKIKRLVWRILAALLAMGVLPIAAAGTTHPRILQFQMEEGEQRLQIYFVAHLEDALFGRVHIGREPSPEEMERVFKEENLVAELHTDNRGYATLDFTREGLPDGVYLVAGENIDPFYVCVPEPDGAGWIYSVEVYPGYHIGGETEPKPTGTTQVTMEPEPYRELEGVLLLMAACGALFLRMLRPQCW